ncbi:hypothetical protein D3C72_570900 [compost metagenome]
MLHVGRHHHLGSIGPARLDGVYLGLNPLHLGRLPLFGLTSAHCWTSITGGRLHLAVATKMFFR